MEKDHPELDNNTEWDETGIKQYQSLIGALQWLITLGRFDVLVSVSTMSGYPIAPREGHLERLKHVFGYIKKHPDGTIRFRTNIPDHESQGTHNNFDWCSEVYGNTSEELPPDMPTPKQSCKDSNLWRCQPIPWCRNWSFGYWYSSSHNQTPCHWHSKCQGRVQTATYGSEFMAVCTAIDQITDQRYTPRMMGCLVMVLVGCLEITKVLLPHQQSPNQH
jgi:hypothetical protein